MQNLKDHLFCSTSANDCVWISEIQTTNNVIYTLTENFIFSFKIYKTLSCLLGFANFSCTEFLFAFAFFSHTISNISHNISNVLFSSSLNRLNAFSHYQKLVLISNAQNLSSGLFRDTDKHCTTASLIKVPPLKEGVYLILEVHCTLFTDPT